MPYNKLTPFKLERMKKFIRNNPDVSYEDMSWLFGVAKSTVCRVSQLIRKEKEDDRRTDLENTSKAE